MRVKKLQELRYLQTLHVSPAGEAHAALVQSRQFRRESGFRREYLHYGRVNGRAVRVRGKLD